MKLHEDGENFKSLLDIVSNYYNLDIRIVEKDYWITLALSKLVNYEKKDKIIFRGGTSLTKCYTDLKRFSEDIDLAVNNDNDLTNSQIKKIIKNVEKCMCSDFDEDTESPSNVKSGAYRNVEYRYKTAFDVGGLREMNPSIKIETVTFMSPNPYEKKQVKSMICEYLMETNRYDVVETYELEPFEINVLSIKRTVIDKIVSLVRMSYSTDLSELKSKTRHLYDLHLTYNYVENFYKDSRELTNIIELVMKDEEESRFKEQYPYKECWSNAPIFKFVNDELLKESYENIFGKEFVYGTLPSYEDIKTTFKKIQAHLKAVNE